MIQDSIKKKKKKKMLTSVLGTLVKNSVKKSFDITFMKNKKKAVKILIVFFSFSIIFFFNWVLNRP